MLALGCDKQFTDGLPLGESLQVAGQFQAITVLPWGFGKWWLRRRAVVADVIRSARKWRAEHNIEVFLGDNSGRLRHFRQPWLFDAARAAAVRILPGSDPLPFRSHNRNAGRYGFVIHGAVGLKHPARDIKRLITTWPGQPRSYGRRETLGNFCRDQVAIQIRSLRRRCLATTPVRGRAQSSHDRRGDA